MATLVAFCAAMSEAWAVLEGWAFCGRALIVVRKVIGARRNANWKCIMFFNVPVVYAIPQRHLSLRNLVRHRVEIPCYRDLGLEYVNFAMALGKFPIGAKLSPGRILFFCSKKKTVRLKPESAYAT